MERDLKETQKDSEETQTRLKRDSELQLQLSLVVDHIQGRLCPCQFI